MVRRFSHGLTLMALISLLLLGATLTTENTEPTEILVIDLSKRLPENPYQEEYERMLYPTVRIKAGFSTGSGVVIDKYIITAAHVVGNQSEVTVEFFHRRDAENAEISAIVVITDTIKDLALLKPSRPLPYKATLAPADYRPYIFTPVYSVGCSLGLVPRPSQGIITVIHRRDAENAENYWEVSSPILPGNSGGPVYDGKTFEVIGIAVWVHTYKNQIVTTMAGVVPINEIYKFLEPQMNTDEHRK